MGVYCITPMGRAHSKDLGPDCCHASAACVGLTLGSSDARQELGVAFGSTDKREAEMLESERAKAQTALKVPCAMRLVPGPRPHACVGVSCSQVVSNPVQLGLPRRSLHGASGV